MTICIATICQGDSVVMASDKMVTLSLPSTEFERNESKIRHLTANSAIATAGDALIHEEVLRRAQEDLQGVEYISNIAEVMAGGYVAERKRLAEEQVLLPVGLTFPEFYEKQTLLLPEIATQALMALGNFQFDFFMIIGGIDSTGPHIYLIHPPGSCRCMDAIGVCAIGTGEIHAFQTFISYGYEKTMDLQKTILMTFEAKKRAEKAAGVGKKTDMLILREDKEPYTLTPEQIAELEEFHEVRIEKERTDLKEFEKVSLELP